MIRMRLPLIFSPPDALLRWASDRLEGADFGSAAIPVGVQRDGRLVAVCVYHHPRATEVSISFAADHPQWATKPVIIFMMAYPFLEWPNLRRLTAVARASNKSSRKLLEGIGARCEGRLRDLYVGPPEDGIQYAITRRWWGRSRWYVRPAQQEAA